MDTGHWILNESVTITEKTFGFIYEITNTVLDKKYIGKKQCSSRIKRKPLKGKTRNRIDHKESDWKSYTSSSNDLMEDIKKYGKDKFIFKILRTCDSKWALAYFEAKEQMEKDVLFRKDYYNGILNLRIGKAPKQELEKFNILD
jgi:molecular chaperone GrpE (heat shock protein)